MDGRPANRACIFLDPYGWIWRHIALVLANPPVVFSHEGTVAHCASAIWLVDRCYAKFLSMHTLPCRRHHLFLGKQSS